VDILGIDGIIYKGRLNSQATSGTATQGKDFPGRGAALGTVLAPARASSA